MQNQQLQAGYTVPWGEFTILKNHFLVSWVAISVLSLYLLESIGNKQVSNVPHFFGAPTQQQHSSPALQRSPAGRPSCELDQGQAGQAGCLSHCTHLLQLAEQALALALVSQLHRAGILLVGLS